MKKTILAISVLQTLLMVGCGGPQQMPGQIGTQYGVGAGYGNDPYATGGYANTPNYSNDPYATGGYTNTPNYSNDPYANGGINTGVNNQYGTGTYANGVSGVNQIDPLTGQPIINASQVSQQIISKIQAAGGSGALKADDAVRESLKGISVQQSLGQSPLEHRSTIIKTLLDGYATQEDRSFAMEVWNTILPQDQQNLMSQDSELSELVTDKLLKDSSGGISSILGSAKKLIGLG